MLASVGPPSGTCTVTLCIGFLFVIIIICTRSTTGPIIRSTPSRTNEQLWGDCRRTLEPVTPQHLHLRQCCLEIQPSKLGLGRLLVRLSTVTLTNYAVFFGLFYFTSLSL